MYRQLSGSYSALKQKTEEYRKAEELIRTLHHKLIIAQDAERKRISLDIHDSIIQDIAVLLYRYKTGENRTLSGCYEIFKSVIERLRKLVYGLCPFTLGTVRTCGFCQRILRKFSERNGHYN